jgi:hypothetical protein
MISPPTQPVSASATRFQQDTAGQQNFFHRFRGLQMTQINDSGYVLARQ